MKFTHCRPILEKLRHRLSGWKAHPLSFAGRLELIKATISSMHLYWSSSFFPPKECLKLMEKHVRNFFGGNFERQNGLKTVAWSTICAPINNGGLGIHCIEALAEAALKRQTWFVASNRLSLDQLGKGKIH